MPDVWSVMPTKTEFTELEKVYKEALENKINPKTIVIEDDEDSPGVKEQSQQNEDNEKANEDDKV